MIPLKPELMPVLDNILADAVLVKRLRYITAMGKVGQNPTSNQTRMVAQVVISHLQAAGLNLDSHALAEFMQHCIKEVWTHSPGDQQVAAIKIALRKYGTKVAVSDHEPS